MATIIDLGKRVKQKYPGVYDNLPDAEVGRRVKTKYPGSYDDFTEIASTTSVPSPSPEFQSIGANVGLGAVKGALNTASGLVTGLANVIGKGVNKVSGSERYVHITRKQFTQNAEEMGGFAQAFTPPKGTAQKVGFVAEQIGEFFVPGGAVAKGAKAVQGVKALSKVPKLAKLAGFGTRVAGEAGTSAGLTALQGGSGEQVKEAGILSALFPIVGKGAKTVAGTKFMTQKLPSRFLNSIIKPGESAFNFGKNPGLGVAQEGITANTRGGLLTNIFKRRQEVGTAIRSAVKEPTIASQVLDTTSALAPIDNAIQNAVKSGEKGLVNRLLDLKRSMTREFKLVGDEIIDVGPKNLSLNPEGILDAKIALGNNTRWTGQAFDSDINKVRVAVYKNLDSMLDRAAPGIDKLNSRYANLITAEKALEKTNKKLQRLVLAGLRQTGVGTAYGLYSAATGDSGPEAIAKGLFGAGLFALTGSTAVKSRVAKQFTNMPKIQEKLGTAANVGLRAYLGGKQKGNNDNAK